MESDQANPLADISDEAIQAMTSDACRVAQSTHHAATERFFADIESSLREAFCKENTSSHEAAQGKGAAP